jgi:hypothetical protein
VFYSLFYTVTCKHKKRAGRYDTLFLLGSPEIVLKFQHSSVTIHEKTKVHCSPDSSIISKRGHLLSSVYWCVVFICVYSLDIVLEIYSFSDSGVAEETLWREDLEEIAHSRRMFAKERFR